MKDREELLIARMRQLDERELVEARVVDELEISRHINKNYFD
jgi:orotate phosphoribosyltransferase-like protein